MRARCSRRPEFPLGRGDDASDFQSVAAGTERRRRAGLPMRARKPFSSIRARHDRPPADRIREAAPAVACRRRVLHGVARHDDPEHGGAHDRRRAQRRAAQHEGGAHELHHQPGRLHPDQRLDRGPVRDAAGCSSRRSGSSRSAPSCAGSPSTCPCSSALRILQGCGGRAHDARRADHHGADLPEGRARPRDELRRGAGADRAPAWAARRRAHRRLPALADDLLRQPSRWGSSGCTSSSGTCPTTGPSDSDPIDFVGPRALRLGHRPPLLRPRDLRRARARR